jgi:RNA recognition motif-containing protein
MTILLLFTVFYSFLIIFLKSTEWNVKQIYVGNIPYSKTEEDLHDLFAQFGTVNSVKFVNDRETGRFRGFGFVEMADGPCADEAISDLEGKDFDGRTLRVNEARPRPARPPRDTW